MQPPGLLFVGDWVLLRVADAFVVEARVDELYLSSEESKPRARLMVYAPPSLVESVGDLLAKKPLPTPFRHVIPATAQQKPIPGKWLVTVTNPLATEFLFAVRRKGLTATHVTRKSPWPVVPLANWMTGDQCVVIQQWGTLLSSQQDTKTNACPFPCANVTVVSVRAVLGMIVMKDKDAKQQEMDDDLEDHLAIDTLRVWDVTHSTLKASAANGTHSAHGGWQFK